MSPPKARQVRGDGEHRVAGVQHGVRAGELHFPLSFPVEVESGPPLPVGSLDKAIAEAKEQRAKAKVKAGDPANTATKKLAEMIDLKLPSAPTIHSLPSIAAAKGRRSSRFVPARCYMRPSSVIQSPATHLSPQRQGEPAAHLDRRWRELHCGRSDQRPRAAPLPVAPGPGPDITDTTPTSPRPGGPTIPGH